LVAGVVKDRNEELTALGRPDLIPALQPTYRLGCKRIVFSSDYIKSVARPNVHLVQSPIKEIKDKTIVTEDGHVEEVDILVLGTGYKTQEGILGNIESMVSVIVLLSKFVLLTLSFFMQLSEMKDSL
jgi:cation diffusion facilitator CzcD-associated flavoprotein CzcO